MKGEVQEKSIRLRLVSFQLMLLTLASALVIYGFEIGAIWLIGLLGFAAGTLTNMIAAICIFKN
jgi:hypothetical protein